MISEDEIPEDFLAMEKGSTVLGPLLQLVKDIKIAEKRRIYMYFIGGVCKLLFKPILNGLVSF